MNVESNVQSNMVFRHIMVPHDLTVRSDRAVMLAGTMAHPLRSRVILIHVIDSSAGIENEGVHLMSEGADIARNRWKFLTNSAKHLLPADVKSEVRIHSGDPQKVILSEARKLGADLMIITTHPLTGVGYPFHGGNIEHIQQKASCSVLTVQVSEEDEASLVKEEMRKVETHNLRQYCELSRLLSKKDPHRPVYIGYSRLPSNPSGVCD